MSVKQIKIKHCDGYGVSQEFCDNITFVFSEILEGHPELVDVNFYYSGFSVFLEIDTLAEIEHLFYLFVMDNMYNEEDIPVVIPLEDFLGYTESMMCDTNFI